MTPAMTAALVALRATWQQLRRQPLFAATATVLVISCLLSAGAAGTAYLAQRETARQNDRLEQLVDDLQAQRDVDRARQCINSWDGRRGVRALIEGLIVAFQGAPPARVEAFREDMARRLPDPTCDLDAALEVVATADEPPAPPG